MKNERHGSDMGITGKKDESREGCAKNGYQFCDCTTNFHLGLK